MRDDGIAVERVREVYDASYRRLVAQLIGVTGDREEAEDVVMEAFARAVNRPRDFGATTNPEAWLRTVAVNVARSRWRRAARFWSLAPRLHARETAPDPDLPTERMALFDALRALPEAQRVAIALHHLADLPVSQVAETLGLPEGTVKAQLSRGRATLAKTLDNAHEGV